MYFYMYEICPKSAKVPYQTLIFKNMAMKLVSAILYNGEERVLDTLEIEGMNGFNWVLTPAGTNILWNL